MNSNLHEQISERLLAMQRGFVTEIEKERKASHVGTQQMDLLLVGLIEIIELFENLSNDGSVDHTRLLHKTQRRLSALLEKFEVTEIQIDGNQLKPGFVRVLESRGGPSVQVCRRGYVRGSRVLRPAEVIT